MHTRARSVLRSPLPSYRISVDPERLWLGRLGLEPAQEDRYAPGDGRSESSHHRLETTPVERTRMGLEPLDPDRARSEIRQ